MFLLGLALLSLLAVLLIFFFASGRKDARAALYRPLKLPGAEKGDANFLRDASQSLEKRIRAAFLEREELFIDARRLTHEEESDVSTPLTWKTTEEGRCRAQDQLLLGEYYLSQGNRRSFLRWRENFCRFYLPDEEKFPLAFPTDEGAQRENPQQRWPLLMNYLRCLLAGGRLWQDARLIDEALNRSEALLLLFQTTLPPDAVILEETADYPQVSSSSGRGEERLSEEAAVVRLSSIDLWTLQSLAALDGSWTETEAAWRVRLREASLGDGLYAFGYEPQTQSFCPSSGEAFRSENVENLLIILHRHEAGEDTTKDLKAYGEHIFQTGAIKKAQHLASGAAMSAEDDPAAAALFLRLARLSASPVNEEAALTALGHSRNNLKNSRGEGMLYRIREGKKAFYYARDNLFLLLAGE